MFTLILLTALLIPFLIVAGIAALVWKPRRGAILRWTVRAYLGAVVLVLVVVGPYLTAWFVSHAGTRPPDRVLKDTPADYGVPHEEIVFDARDSLRLSGWFVPPAEKNAILICTHGLFRNRVEMLSRAMAAAKQGFGALLYDSRSHGASDKAVVSLGYYEKQDVLGAIQYIQRRYQHAPEQPRIVLVGISMGAVATLEAAAETKSYAALVLDSPFASLRETIIDHSWLFLKLPRYPFPPLFLFWFEQMAGFDVDLVDSHAAMKRVQPVPLLIIASEGDRRIGPDIARSLYAESRSAVRRLKVFGEDVGHGAAARRYPDEYARLLVDFLESSLQPVARADAGGNPVTPTSGGEGSPR